jgi:hypothetical protein
MKKRTLTPEQTAARDAKRAKFRALIKQIADMPEDRRQELTRGQVVTVDGHALSLVNTLLCVLQLPGVSIVGGFRQWLKAGRCVMKGQHGASIWIPTMKATDAGPEPAAADLDADAPVKSSRRFMCGTVFDIAQTAAADAEPAAVDAPAEELAAA